ncbi:hypothetical protein BD770DRAFT_449594 [Pilaira anomala]|nr:hypothetical protein BD770DRAFT_449594 [Pilaira anomala]
MSNYTLPNPSNSNKRLRVSTNQEAWMNDEVYRCAFDRIKTKENHRGKHLVMFESCHIDKKSCDTTDEEYTSFLALIEVMKSHKVANYDPCIPVVTMNIHKEQQLLDDPECRIIDPKYAVINLSDITRQVELVQSYYVFNKGIKSSAGSIQNL